MDTSTVRPYSAGLEEPQPNKGRHGRPTWDASDDCQLLGPGNSLEDCVTLDVGSPSCQLEVPPTGPIANLGVIHAADRIVCLVWPSQDGHWSRRRRRRLPMVQKACVLPTTLYRVGHFHRNGLEGSPRIPIASGEIRPRSNEQSNSCRAVSQETALEEVPRPPITDQRVDRYARFRPDGRNPSFPPPWCGRSDRSATVSEGRQR